MKNISEEQLSSVTTTRPEFHLITNSSSLMDICWTWAGLLSSGSQSLCPFKSKYIITTHICLLLHELTAKKKLLGSTRGTRAAENEHKHKKMSSLNLIYRRHILRQTVNSDSLITTNYTVNDRNTKTFSVQSKPPTNYNNLLMGSIQRCSEWKSTQCDRLIFSLHPHDLPVKSKDAALNITVRWHLCCDRTFLTPSLLCVCVFS